MNQYGKPEKNLMKIFFWSSKLEWSHQGLRPYYSGMVETLLKVKFRILCHGMGFTNNKQEVIFIFGWEKDLKGRSSQKAPPCISHHFHLF